VFMGGLVLGALTSARMIEWQQVFHPERRVILAAALAFFLFFMLFRLGWTFGLIPTATWDRFVVITNRGKFSLVYLLNFLATGYLLAWTLIAGPRAAEAWPRRIAELLARLFSLPFLRLIGRHSLQVYVFHVFVVYLMLAIDRSFGPFPAVVRTALALLAIASLAIPAWLREADLRGLLRQPIGLQRSAPAD